MSQRRLGDRQVQIAIEQFIKEARVCARTEVNGGILGIAAMSTILSCVMAVGEAIAGKGVENGRRHISLILSEMPDRETWLIPPEGGTWKQSEAVDLLLTIRNGLAHALAIPHNIALVPNQASVALHDRRMWRLVVPLFVDAVEEAMKTVAQKHPHCAVDPNDRGRGQRGVVAVRGPADGATEVTSWGTY